MSRQRTLAALAISFAAALWGLDGVVLTPRLHPLPVLFVVFLLHAVPFALMQPVLGRLWGRLRRLTPRELVTLALVSGVGGVTGTLAIVKALFLVDFNQLSVVVLLQKLQPIFAILLAALLLGERVTARFLGRAAVAVTGGYTSPSVCTDPRSTSAARPPRRRFGRSSPPHLWRRRLGAWFQEGPRTGRWWGGPQRPAPSLRGSARPCAGRP